MVSLKGRDMETGDLAAFYIGNKLLVKRVIAAPGDTVEIVEDGTVTVNWTVLVAPILAGPLVAALLVWLLLEDARKTKKEGHKSHERDH